MVSTYWEANKKMKTNKAETLKSYLVITVGTVIMAAGIYFFKFPNNFSTGGVSALSMILTALFPILTAGQYMMIINVLLLIVGLLVFGKNFAVKTIYSSLLLSICTRVFEVIVPLAQPLTNEKFLELIFAIGLTAIGSALIFNEAASSGGTDIIAMILKKYTSFNIGNALLITDCLIVLTSFFTFGIETGLYSVLGLLVKSFVVDNIIESINLCKSFNIICDHPEPICDYIMNELHHSATIYEAKGAFSNQPKKVIITVMSRPQASQLRKYIKTVEPSAFMIITNSSEIIGKGFQN